MPITSLPRPDHTTSSQPEPAELPPTSQWLALQASLENTRSRWKKGIDFGKECGHALEWSLPEIFSQRIRGVWKDLFDKGALSGAKWKKIHENWCQWQTHPAASESHAWEALVWLRALVTHSAPFTRGAQFTSVEASALLTRLIEQAEEAALQNASHDPLQFQWLAVEIPWSLGLLAGEHTLGKAWREQAQAALVRLMQDCADEAGLVQGRYLPCLPVILASWTRCQQLAHAFDQPFFPSEWEARYSLWLQQALRTMRNDGTAVFNEPATGSLLTWLPAAFEWADRPTRQLGKAMSREQAKRKEVDESLTTAHYCASGKWASLRRSFSRNDTHLSIDFDGHRVLLEVGQDETMLSGVWDLEFQVHGEAQEQLQPWEEVLWFADDDVTYLELQTFLGNDWALQRQILLPARGDFVILADCILGESASEMHYRSHYPLASEVGFLPAEETREGWLTHGKKRWLTMPLACPEWRSERSDYELTTVGNQLTYTGARHGRCLFQPLFLSTASLSKKGNAPFTWRRLTVAEQMQIQGPDVAFAARMQVEQEQWILYRSLIERGNRTFMGKNVATEFFFGKFEPEDGTYETIMEVQ